ncbi:MAG: hypothetical protein IKI99_01180, partial [Firmicutes bacterium]|nr:hypothetical protein [Bacillota bacterium]
PTSFNCVYCNAKMDRSDRCIVSNYGIGYDCPNCKASVWKCMQCEEGFTKQIGIAKEGWDIALRCQTCGLNSVEKYVEFCPTCNEPIWDNYIQDNYKISFRYPDEEKRVWKEFLTSTFACKSCNTYAAAEAHDVYNEWYSKLKAVLPEGENIYDYILWSEDIGFEEIENGETTIIAGMEMTAVGRDIYGPDFSWPMETLDDICKYKYKYKPAE